VRGSVRWRPDGQGGGDGEAERAGAEHGDDVTLADAGAKTACTAQATGSVVTASASLSSSGTA
jgi:hypothetical protein